MGLWQSFKRYFVGEDEIEQEEYASYRPQVTEPQTEPVREEPVRTGFSEDNLYKRPAAEQKIQPEPEPTPEPEPVPEPKQTQRNTASESRRSHQERRVQNNRNSRNNRNRTANQESELNMATTAQSSFDLVLARPNNYKEVTTIGDDLNDGRTVILNLEMVKQEDATRILDFLSGVAYANDDEIKMMAQKTYAIMPQNVNFLGVDLVSELENNGYSF
jgi:cell division inhibitor SepF